MATKIPWDIKESILLLHATIKVEEEKESRAEIVKNVSSDLRKLAQSRGLHIDESYRNENGISLQIVRTPSLCESALQHVIEVLTPTPTCSATLGDLFNFGALGLSA